MTYIVAQHMSPDHRSLMVELLARETKLKVVEATNNLPPKPDTIYVAPPNVDITVAKGRIKVSRPTNTIGPKPSVDRFFMSLADDRKDWAIGIILSGTGSDGAHGIKAIKAAGGVSIAQDPKSAKYDSMPNAAIRIGRTDLVLPPHEIANQLRSIVQWPRAPLADEADETPPSTMRGIVRQIATHTGMDFSNYKDATLSRQVLRRMAAMQIPDLDAYGEYIGRHREELAVLAGNFLICVTSFFRDPDAFEAMRRSVRELLKTKQPGDDIRIWVPGCATGEEVYSIAIILAEELGEHRDKYHIQLFATDINGDAVAAARAGAYPETSLIDVDSALIERYFTTVDGTYHIDKRLRDMTLFARQDLVQDAPFVRLDLVSCRNLLIYFKPELQDRVIKVFHYALHDHGVLFLGKSESIGRLGKLFVEHDHKNKIYLKRPVASPVLTGFARTRPVFDRIGDAAIVDKRPAPPMRFARPRQALRTVCARQPADDGCRRDPGAVRRLQPLPRRAQGQGRLQRLHADQAGVPRRTAGLWPSGRCATSRAPSATRCRWSRRARSTTTGWRCIPPASPAPAIPTCCWCASSGSRKSPRQTAPARGARSMPSASRNSNARSSSIAKTCKR